MRWVLLALGTAALAAGIVFPAIGHIGDPSSGTSLLQFAWGEPTLDGVSVFARVTVEGNLTSAQVAIVVAVLIAAWCWTRWRPWGWTCSVVGFALLAASWWPCGSQ